MESYSYFWSTELPVAVWIACAVALVAAVAILYILYPRLRNIVKASRASGSCPVLDKEDYPGVTVVVYSRDNADTLPALIRSIYNQDYIGPVEVVVVCDMSVYDNADEEAAAALIPEFPSLRVTYIPADSRSLSRKKLAVTIGIKAARQPFVAMTCGNCAITSDDWLRRMMTHAAQGKSVVVGASTIRPADEDAPRRALFRGFDEVWQSVRSIGSALAGHPHRATGCNLVYSRDLFFRNNGFAASLNLTYGDDDLFVNEIATDDNTAVELSPGSIVEVLEHNPARAYRLDRLRRDFTARFLPQSPHLAMGMAACCWWIWLAATVVAVVVGLPSLVPAAAMLVVLLALWIPMMRAWRRAARALRASSAACLMVPLLMLWHPLYNLRFRLQGLRHRRDNYTWSKLSK